MIDSDRPGWAVFMEVCGFMKGRYRYIIAGGGLAGASAIKGIREHDSEGTIVLLGAEAHRPYDRPPLSKKLWLGKKKVEDIFIGSPEFYEKNRVELRLGKKAVALDVKAREVRDEEGRVYGYEKLLIATGCQPRKLEIPGADLRDVCYFRTLDDYFFLREKVFDGASAVIIGGGFIGSELAAVLSVNKVSVTMVFPSSYLCNRVLPEALGQSVQKDFIDRGIRVLANTTPTAFEQKGKKFSVLTKERGALECDLLIVGAGVFPSAGLAEGALLKTGDGIEVNSRLQTSDADVYSAGDVASFPYRELGERKRVEHWDNAMSQGQLAGENMAGADKEYDYMPYFFSDLFDFGYEAVGEVSSKLDVVADWQVENKKGVLYYLKDNMVRGVMLCNVWDRVEDARALIRKKEIVTADGLKGRIR